MLLLGHLSVLMKRDINKVFDDNAYCGKLDRYIITTVILFSFVLTKKLFTHFSDPLPDLKSISDGDTTISSLRDFQF